MVDHFGDINKMVDTNSEDHRRECEARHVLKLSKLERIDYYKKIQEKRGEKAMLELIDEVKKQWAVLVMNDRGKA